MPAAIAVPLALAGATMVAQNVQNKAAIKNNENQQRGAVENAQNASNQAFQRFNSWQQANPAPFTGASIARPPGMQAPTETINGISPQSIMSQAFSRGTPEAPWSNFNAALHGPIGSAPQSGGFNPQTFGSLAQVIAAMHGGAGLGAAAPAGVPAALQTMSPQMLLQRVMQQQQPQAPGMVNMQPVMH